MVGRATTIFIRELEGVRVLVTGGAGFIGSHLVRALIDSGALVTILSRPRGNPEGLRIFGDQVEYIDVDLTDAIGVKRVLKGRAFKKIFHLAADTRADRDWEIAGQVFRNNVLGFRNLMLALTDVDFDCFISTGSSEDYGLNQVPFHEDMILNPVSPYGLSRMATWLMGEMLHTMRDLPIVTLRPFTTYGPRQGLNMFIPKLIVSALRGQDFAMSAGEQTRDFLYVSDVVDGYLAAATKEHAIGHTINLGTGIEHRLRDVAEMILELCGRPIKLLVGAVPYRPAEIMRMVCDNKSAKRVLGWKPKVALADGLQRTVEWYATWLKNSDAGRRH